MCHSVTSYHRKVTKPQLQGKNLKSFPEAKLVTSLLDDVTKKTISTRHLHVSQSDPQNSEVACDFIKEVEIDKTTIRSY